MLVPEEHPGHATLAPVSNTFGLPASTASPLPASPRQACCKTPLTNVYSMLPRMIQLPNALSHLTSSPFVSHQSGDQVQQHFVTRPHGLGGQACLLDLPFSKTRQEGKKDTFSKCLIYIRRDGNSCFHKVYIIKCYNLAWLHDTHFQLRQQEQRD